MQRFCQGGECDTTTVPGEDTTTGCVTDADCPDGQVCVDGECVPAQVDDFPLGLLLLILVAVAVAWYASSE